MKSEQSMSGRGYRSASLRARGLTRAGAAGAGTLPVPSWRQPVLLRRWRGLSGRIWLGGKRSPFPRPCACRPVTPGFSDRINPLDTVASGFLFAGTGR